MAKKSRSNTPHTNTKRTAATTAEPLRAAPAGFKRIPLAPFYWAGRDTWCALIDVERAPSPRDRHVAVDALVFVALEPAAVRNFETGELETIPKGKPFRVADPELLRLATLAGEDPSTAHVMLLQRDAQGRIAVHLSADPWPRAELAHFDPKDPTRRPAPPAQSAQTPPS